MPAMFFALALLLASRASADECPTPTGDSAFGDAPPCYEPRSDWPSIRVGAEARLGWLEAEVANDDVGAGFSLFADVSLASFLDLGVSATWLTSADARADADGDGFDDTDEADVQRFVLAGGPRLVWFTEPMRREAFRLAVSGGYAIGVDERSSSGPILEVAIERQAGMLNTGESPPIPRYGTGYDFTLGVRYQQGFADLADYRAILGSVSFAVEVGVPLPTDRTRRRRAPPLEYVLRGGPALGAVRTANQFALSFGGTLELGFPIGDYVIPFARIGAAGVSSTEHSDGAALFWALGGIRFFRWKIFYFDAGVGHDLVVGTDTSSVDFPSLESGPFFELGGGFQIADMECGVGMYFGPKLHVGWAEHGAIGFIIETGISYDNLARAARCTP